MVDKAIDKNIDWLLQRSQKNHDQPAVVTKSQEYTFSELNGLVETASKLFKNSGVKRNNHCAVISNNNIDFIISIFALWRIGAIPVPLNIRLTNSEIKNQIKFTECNYVIIHTELINKYDIDNEVEVIKIPFPKMITESKVVKTNNFQNNKISLMLFTSGSTEKPKAVIFTFGNFINSVLQTNKLLTPKVNNSWLASLPFYHIGGFMILGRSIINGNTLILPNSLSHFDVMESLINFNPSFISFVSTQMKRIIDENIKPSKNLEAVFLGGGPINEDLITACKKNNWPIIKVYGSTETCSMVSALDLRNKIIKINSAGKELQKNTISVSELNNGEIIVEGESVAKGYFNDSGIKLKNGKFYSNDIGFIDNKGYLFIKGRADDIIISGGENIDTNEITKVLLEHPGIKDAFSFGISDKEWGTLLSAAVVLKTKNLKPEKIIDFLKTKLADYKIPKKIFIIDKMPKTDLGKINKEELLKIIKLC